MTDAVPAIEDLRVMTYIYTGQYEADVYNTIVTVSNESVFAWKQYNNHLFLFMIIVIGISKICPPQT